MHTEVGSRYLREDKGETFQVTGHARPSTATWMRSMPQVLGDAAARSCRSRRPRSPGKTPPPGRAADRARGGGGRRGGATQAGGSSPCALTP